MSARMTLVLAGLPLLAVSLLGTGCGSRQARRGPAEVPPPVVVEEPTVVVPPGSGPVVAKEGPVVAASGPAPAKNGPPAHAPAHGYRRKQQARAAHSYHYYPSRYLYYSPQRGLYWYMRSGQWEVAVNLPDFLNKDGKDGLGEFVVVKSEHENPYMEFEVHKSAHPGPDAKEAKKAKGKQGKGGNGKGKGKKGKGPEGTVE